MGFKVRAFFLSSVLVLALAYFTRPRFPDTANNPGIKSMTGVLFNGIFLIGKIGHHLGISSYVNITRSLFGLLASLLDDGGNSNIEQSSDTIAGVKVLIFRPKGQTSKKRPGIVYYHGGGWMFMSAEIYASVTREIAEQTQSVVISVEYRLAPEHIFPAPFDDCLQVTRSVLSNAENYGIDKEKIGIMGDSAGGNLAMAVALALAKDEDTSLPKVRVLILVYPALQAFDFDLPAYITHSEGPGLLTKKPMIAYWLIYAFGNSSLYKDFAANTHISDELRRSKYAEYVAYNLLPDKIQKSVSGKRTFANNNNTLSNQIENIILDPRFAPLMASDENLAKLPATYILITEFDVLRDDGFLAAARLHEVGVDVEHTYLPGETHGLLTMAAFDNNAILEIKRIATFFNKTIS